MYKITYMKIIINIIIFILSFEQDALSDTYNLYAPYCAAEAMYNVCNSFYIGDNYDQFCTKLGIVAGGKSSINALCSIAHKYGLKVKALKIGIGELAKHNAPGVILMCDGHSYAILSRVDHMGTERRLRVKHAFMDSIFATSSDLESEYTGIAILVSTKNNLLPNITRNTPDLRCEPYMYDLGDLTQDMVVTRTFSLRNCGSKPIIISNIKSLNSALSVKDNAIHITPKGTVDLQVMITTKELTNTEVLGLQLYSNDPAVPKLKLLIKCHIVQKSKQ